MLLDQGNHIEWRLGDKEYFTFWLDERTYWMYRISYNGKSTWHHQNVKKLFRMIRNDMKFTPGNMLRFAAFEIEVKKYARKLLARRRRLALESRVIKTNKKQKGHNDDTQ